MKQYLISADAGMVDEATLNKWYQMAVLLADIAVDDFGTGYSCLRDPPLPTARSVFLQVQSQNTRAMPY